MTWVTRSHPLVCVRTLVCVCAYMCACVCIYMVQLVAMYACIALEEVVGEATFDTYKLKLERKVDIGMYLHTQLYVCHVYYTLDSISHDLVG